MGLRDDAWCGIVSNIGRVTQFIKMASKGDVLPEEISDSDDYNDSSEEDIEDTLQQEEEEAKALGEEDNEQDDLEAEANM